MDADADTTDRYQIQFPCIGVEAESRGGGIVRVLSVRPIPIRGGGGGGHLPLYLPALPSVPPNIRHSGVASPLCVGGAAAAAQILEAGPAEEERSGGVGAEETWLNMSILEIKYPINFKY